MAAGVYQTQNMTILALLQRGVSITSMEAIKGYGITRLARVINDLKEDGHSIEDLWESGNGKRWKRYFMALPKGQLNLPMFQSAQAVL